MKKNEIFQVEIPEELRVKLLVELGDLCINPFHNLELAQQLSQQVLTNLLPYGIEAKLKEVLESKNQPVILINNCPLVGSFLPPTPQDDSRNGKDFIAELFVLGLAGLFGLKPFINPGELNDKFCHDVIPKVEHKNEQSSKGSNVGFVHHVENPHRCSLTSVIALGCLRGHPDAITGFVSIDEIINNLPKPIIKTLMEPIFTFKTGPSYNTPMQLCGAPVISFNGSEFEIRFNANPDRVSAETEKGESAISYLRNLLKNENLGSGIILERNQLALFLNSRVLHTRSPFEINDTVEEFRWLIRIYFDFQNNTI